MNCLPGPGTLETSQEIVFRPEPRICKARYWNGNRPLTPHRSNPNLGHTRDLSEEAIYQCARPDCFSCQVSFPKDERIRTIVSH